MANKKISELTAIDAVSGVDLFAVVDDPAGTPITKKGTLTQVLATAEKTANKGIASGYVGFDANLRVLVGDGTESLPGLAFISSPALGFLRVDGNEVRFCSTTNFGIFGPRGNATASLGSASRPWNQLQVYNITAYGGVTVTGSVIVGAANVHGWTTRSLLKSPSDGVVTLLNFAETGFTSLQFGGTGVSYPAWKRSGTELHARLADDSGYATIDAGAYKVGGVAGVSFGPAAVASITVVNGIVTAIS